MTVAGWHQATHYLAERFATVEVGQPDRSGVRKLSAGDVPGEARTRWLVASDGTIVGAWDPERTVEDYWTRQAAAEEER